ncbi:MAG: glycosyl hydrolase family 2 protein [Planctomycetota bacterium]|jgi:hypothetical protein
MMMELAQHFQNPPAIWRDAPFWSWNGALDPDRLCRQIESMERLGFGGFFMHSRYGLKTPYLSEEWFENITACVEKARATGMKAYLYDEDRWPSGSAAGAVTRELPEFRSLSLRRGTVAPENAQACLGHFKLHRDGEGRLTSYEKLTGPEGADESYWLCPDEPSAWFNGGTYIDTLNPDAVDAFLASTYDLYAARYGEDFGGVIPAMFTDEYYVASKRGADAVPWTGVLETVIAARFSVAIVEHLPELYHELAAAPFSSVRYLYYRSVSDLFTENFTARVARWCGAHGIALTGHLLEEESLRRIMPSIVSAMPHYEHMQWPGIDVLGDAGRDKLVMTKQCTSVASQFDKERCLSELYGGVGWDWPLSGHKAVGDWHAVLGINFRCVHLVHYSLAGGAKRDWLPSQYEHCAWWPYYHRVEDYFGRLNFMLAQGRAIRDILVLHPMESAWGIYRPQDGFVEDEVATLGYSLHNLCEPLSDHHLDYDLGDESIMAGHGAVEGDRFRVGASRYRLVIVPPALTLRRTTLELLAAFHEAGGQVLFVGAAPTHVEGVPCTEVHQLSRRTLSCEEGDAALIESVEAVLPRHISIREDGEEARHCWSLLRDIEGGRLLFLHTHDRNEGHDLDLEVSAPEGPVILWDAAVGRCSELPHKRRGGKVCFTLDLPPIGSALISFGLEVKDLHSGQAQGGTGEGSPVPGPYAVQLTEPNTLPLDFCSYQLGDEPASDCVPVLQADREIRACFGEGARLGDQEQPWFLAQEKREETPSMPLGLTFRFHASTLPSTCRLVVENRDAFRITVNGKEAGAVEGWWVCEDLTTVDITPCLVLGNNEVVLTVDYTTEVELENLILVGDFGVGLIDTQRPRTHDNYTLTGLPAQLFCGSWVGQGLDFYGGGVRYRIPVEEGQTRVAVEADCTAAAVHAGDTSVPLLWAPYEAEVEAPEGGIEVEVIGGRRNTLGGNHVPGSGAQGPCFDSTHPQWSDAYILSNHGLMESVIVTRRQEREK